MLPLFLFGSFCVAFLLAFVLNRLALIPWRRSAGQHWTERARLLYPVRKSALFNFFLIPFCLGFLCSVIAPGINCFLVGLAGFFGTTLAGFFFQREIFPALNFRLWLRSALAIFFLVLVWFFVLAIAIIEMPDNFGLATWLVAGVVFVLFLLYPFGLGLLLLRWFHIVLPATEALKRLVAEVSQAMQIPVRATWILPSYISNAAAFPHTGQLLFTDKLLATLPDEETKAICAHELGHLSESRSVKFVRGFTLLAFFPLIFTGPLLGLDHNNLKMLAGLIGLCLFLLLVLLFIKRMGRRMEMRADKIAVEKHSDGAVYARALLRLYEAGQIPAVMPRRSSQVHPDLYDRMTAAGVTPDFPKPLPPKKQCWTSRWMFVCFMLILIVPIFWKALQVTLKANNSN